MASVRLEIPSFFRRKPRICTSLLQPAVQIPTHEACRAEVLTSYAENDSLVRRGCCSLLDGELEQRCVVPHNKMYCVVVKTVRRRFILKRRSPRSSGLPSHEVPQEV